MAGVARAPELVGPDSSSRSGPRVTSAKGGGAGVEAEAEVGGVEVDGGLHVVDEVADAGVLDGCGHGESSSRSVAASTGSRCRMRVSMSAAVRWKAG